METNLKNDLKNQIIEALKEVYDPEISVNVYDFGLILSIDIDDSKNVAIAMTLSTPNCPVAPMITHSVEEAVKGIPSVGKVSVELTWDKPWNEDMMSEAAKLELGML